jgi:hypothetical protein
MKLAKTISNFGLVAVMCGDIGCAGIDRVGRNMDIASEHVSTDKPVYEGHLQSAKQIGALTAIQFADGKSFEVVEYPSSLVPGDVVRIYKTDKGYIAHLWKASKGQIPPGVLPEGSAPSMSK